MKEIKLSQLATGIPKIEYNLGIKEALKAFEEYGMYDFLVVVMDNKPIGIVNKLDLVKAQHREHLTVGDIAHPLMKLREATLKPEHLTSLLDFFKSCKLPILLVDKKGSYMGVLFYHVVLYQASLFKEATIPMFQKLRSLFGHEYYFYCFYIRGLKEFMEEYGSSKAESLQRVLYEAVKTSIHGDVSLSYEENEVYALSKVKLREEEIMNLYMEFQREFSLLYSDVSPVYLLGYCIPMKNLKNFEEFFRISSELKKRMEEVYDASCFIFHEEKPSVVLCEYERRELIHHIRSRIKQDFESIVESIKRTDRDLWEFTLYDFFKKYPYFELFYIIGENGLQVSNNVVNPKLNYTIKTGKKGADRSEKEYFKRASHEDVYISNIYISQATDDFCITVSKKFSYGEKSYVLAGDINYREVHKLVKGYAEELKADR